MFHNAVEFAVLYPGEDAPRWAFCAPRLNDDPKVEAVWGGAPRAPASRSRLARCKAGSILREAGLVRGWARDAANSDMPVPVEVVVDGVVLGSTLANRYRADLATAGPWDLERAGAIVGRSYRRSPLRGSSSSWSLTKRDPRTVIAFIGNIGLQRGGSCPFWTLKAPIDDSCAAAELPSVAGGPV